jgi:hypothetical protein
MQMSTDDGKTIKADDVELARVVEPTTYRRSNRRRPSVPQL